jgi:hypothetical protein
MGIFDGVLVTRRLSDVENGVVTTAAVVVTVSVPLNTVVICRFTQDPWPMLTPKYGPV